MPSFPLILAEAAVSLEWSSIAWILAGVGAALTASGKAVWAYWTNREKTKRDGWIKVVDGKDELIRNKDAEIARLNDEHAKALKKLNEDQDQEVRDLRKELTEQFLAAMQQKDATNADLSKKLSEKSDEVASTIQKLMGMTLEKVEAWGDKYRLSQEDLAKVIQDFAVELRKLNNGGSDAGSLGG